MTSVSASSRAEYPSKSRNTQAMPPISKSFRISTLLTLCLLGPTACGDAKISDEGDSADDLPADTNADTVGSSDTLAETAGSETSSDSSDTSEDTGTFAPPDSWDTTGGDPSCDPFAQDCPDAEKCVPFSNDGSSSLNDTKCVPILGEGKPGDLCVWNGPEEATDDCDAGSMCWVTHEANGVSVGICSQFCQGSADQPLCPDDAYCLLPADLALNVCITTCDPILQQDCPEEHACHFAGNYFECMFAAGSIPTGDPCGFPNDCAAGNACVDGPSLPSCDGGACCAAYCDLNNPACAVPGTECVAWYEQGTAPVGFEHVGVCILPG